MDLKYLNYSLEELLEDKAFLAWILHDDNSDEWEDFIENNSGFRYREQKARKIISLLQNNSKALDEDSIILMWQKIEGFEKFNQQKIRKNRTLRIVSWAASIIIVVALSALIYYLNPEKSAYKFAGTGVSNSSDDATLVLSNGKSIALEKDNSTISLSNNQIVINKDSIIELQGNLLKEDVRVQMNEVIIPFGKKSEILLADGTKVWINAGSRLAFPSKFTKKTREVYLEGEAYFEVAKNEIQPFIVKAGEVDIKVLGTHFDVLSYENDANVEAILLEGSIVMTSSGSFGLGKKEVALTPNQRASFNKEAKNVKVSSAPNAGEYIAWTVGWFQFSRESLDRVFTKLERYYNVEIITPENFPTNELITGKLDLKDSIDKVMKALSDVAKINYRISENKIFIEKKMY